MKYGSQRANYASIRNQYKSLILKKKIDKMPRLTESTLFLTQDINPNKSNYTFEPLETAGQSADEIRLNINDEFIITHYGLYLKGTVTDEAGASSTVQLLTALPIEEMPVGESLKAGNLWAGELSITVNNTKYLEKYDTARFEYAERGRFGTDANTGFNFNEDGIIAAQPLITLSGAKKNRIDIELPESLQAFDFSVIGSQQTMAYSMTQIAMRFFGLNAQNAAKFQ